jgi:CRISPR/Cas system-associated exonuclease Cas4 (RecB family)
MNRNEEEQFADKIKETAMQFQVDNSTLFSRDRSKSVGASEIFRCLRAVKYTKDKLKNKTLMLRHNPKGGFMLRGKIMEDNFIAPVMRNLLGEDGHHLGDDQETYLAKEGGSFLTATPDGIYKKDYLLEFKTFDPRNALDEPKYDHVLQTHVQMGVTGIKTFTYLIYFNASDYFDIRVFKIEYDEEIYNRALDRAKRIMNEEAHDLPPEGQIRADCDYCEHKDICGEESHKAFARMADEMPKKPKRYVPPVTRDEDARGLTNLFFAARREKTDAEKRFKEIEAGLKLYMIEHEFTNIPSDYGTVEITFPKPREVVDREAIEKEFNISFSDYTHVVNDKPKPLLKIIDKK